LLAQATEVIQRPAASSSGPSAPQAPAQLASVPHIGYLDNTPQPASLADFPLSQQLRQLGYVEGKTIVVDYRFTNGDNDSLAENSSSRPTLDSGSCTLSNFIATETTRPGSAPPTGKTGAPGASGR